MKHRALALSVAALIMATAATPSLAGQAHLDGLRSDTAFDQFIVKYRNGSAERANSTAIDRGLARASLAVAGKRALGVKHFRRMSLGADVIRTDRKLDRIDAETLMRRIAADPNVEYVEVDVRMRPTLTPNDPRYPDQWHYFSATAGINLPTAWDKSTGSGIVVAVLDTGSTPHSDLDANTVAGYDFITNTTTSQDGNGRDNNPNDPGDWYTNSACGLGAPPSANSSWHGTHVAGTIGALTNNGNGVAGVAYGARIQHVRVLGRCGGSLSDIADGVIWASGGTVSGIPANQTPARIINMSLGGGGTCSTTFQNAINGAVGRGTTVIVAAGNSDGNAANFQPASCANVVAVGAIDINGARSVWSPTQKSNYGSNVDLSAPGSNIWSTLNTGTQGQGTESYASYGGTSMAAPHVAGVAALVQSRRQAAGQSLFTPAQLETHLRNNVRAFPATPDQPIGTGIVNADAAVTAAVPPPSAPVINSFTCSGTGGGYCSVSATSATPMTYAWSGGFSSSCTGPTCSNVCGTLGSFTIKVTVTVTNSIGSTTAEAWPFCQRSW